MQLTQIDIIKYKSIKQKVSIAFNNGRVVALIGKNGSGKTNVLEAIRTALGKKTFYAGRNHECVVKYHFELTDEEADEYFSCVLSEQRSKHITVDFGSADNVRLIEYSSIWIEASTYKQRLNSALDRFKAAAQAYINALKKIESDEYGFSIGVDVKVEYREHEHCDMPITANMKYMIDTCRSTMKENIARMADYIDSKFVGDKITLDSYDSGRYDNSVSYPKLCKVSARDWISVGPVAAKALKLDEDNVKQANASINKKLEKINAALSAEYDVMKSALDEYNEVLHEITRIFGPMIDNLYEHNDSVTERYKTFMEKLKQHALFNCYYLDNEKTLLFFSDRAYNYDRYDVRERYLNSFNPIEAAFDRFLHDNGVINKDVSLTHGKDLSEATVASILSALNDKFLPSIVASFDSDEIVKFGVTYENRSFELYVHEKSGDVVPFNETSLGRRWYLTYRFVKTLLRPDDVLFIDEPAAFMHQLAQTEVRKELRELGRNGVYVFYSTHSPYLIPEDWSQVYNVFMTDGGTRVQSFSSGDELCEVIKSDLGAIGAADILLNLSKTLLLVEGVSDKVCVEKFAELLGYDLSDYHIHVCEGDAILQVAYVCFMYKIKVKVMLDTDNKKKGSGFKNSHKMYEQCLDAIESRPHARVFVGDEDGQGCLEDLFDEPNKKLMVYNRSKKKLKVDHAKIRKLNNIGQVSAKTAENFDALLRELGIPKTNKR